MIWVRITLDMDFFLLYVVCHSREAFNINLPVAHYDTNHAERGHKSKDVMRMLVENKTKFINYGDKAVHTHSRIF